MVPGWNPPVLLTPEFASGCGELQIEAIAVKQADRLGSGLRFFDLGGSELHVHLCG